MELIINSKFQILLNWLKGDLEKYSDEFYEFSIGEAEYYLVYRFVPADLQTVFPFFKFDGLRLDQIEDHLEEIQLGRIELREIDDYKVQIIGSSYKEAFAPILTRIIEEINRLWKIEQTIPTQRNIPATQNTIEYRNWDEIAITLWKGGSSNHQIAEELKKKNIRVSDRRVTNRLGELRDKWGTEVVPYDNDRRKQK